MSKVDYIWRKSPVSKTHKYLDNFPVIKKLLNIRQDSFISTLKEQLSKIDDRDHVLVDVSPLCTQYIDKTSNLDKALADYFTAEKKQQIKASYPPGLVDGMSYKQWCHKNMAQLVKWDEASMRCNELLEYSLSNETWDSTSDDNLKYWNNEYEKISNDLLEDLRRHSTIIDIDNLKNSNQHQSVKDDSGCAPKAPM
ncbi:MULTISPECIES: hypothetical protein [Hafniaceae]|mgnify:CR=1 FL=1|uniref:hypothetical protein n=1 Tax=Hafniaceae TaxID=1903412 RepID=UPI000BB565E7|nr:MULTISPECIES: hypothetical protein [Hafniaceae]MDN6437457.1 hypothetical protein [Lactococcus sp.]MDX6842976.1 hypothetical protein [Hafnia paralvei]PNK70578.1 hypothetical protein A6J69_000250 [Hafnia paralvei]TBM06063.1 hypothetical protein EYY93_02060 [Hafnia paralvei]TBM07665.1 hypothetical protein EYY87_02375 [Hafnia paralvei]